MPKSTAQLRTELAEAVKGYKANRAWYGSVNKSAETMADAAEALLTHLEGQPSRQGKPFKVTYQHTEGFHAGRIYHDSHYTLEAAAKQMRTVIGARGRVDLAVKDDSGEWHGKDAAYLMAMGYNDIVASGLYGDKHYSQEA
jgi:hypothetical protein